MREIKRIREERGLSRAKLAARSELNPATINRIERGTVSPNVETLEKLAEALECEVADFFPKRQSPLPWDSAIETSMYEDAIAFAAGEWLEELQSGGVDKIRASGLRSAALDLGRALDSNFGSGTEFSHEWEFAGIPAEEKRGLIYVLNLLIRVARASNETLKASNDGAE